MEHDNLKIVLVDHPYKNIHDTEVKNILPKIIELKKNGYEQEYQQGCIPVGMCDLHATHFLICDTTDGGLTPICGNKGTHISRCHEYNLSNPATKMMKETNEMAAKQLEKLEKRCLQQGNELIYFTSWTATPSIRKSKVMKTVKDLFSTAICMFKYDYLPNSEYLTAGVERLNTDKFITGLGFQPISNSPRCLHPQLNNEQIIMMHMTDYSDKTKNISEQYLWHWENRITIGEETLKKLRKGKTKKAA